MNKKAETSNVEEVLRILKIRDDRDVAEEKKRMLLPDDDDETMMKKIKASVMQQNPIVFAYIKDAKMITTEAFIGHKAHYILIYSENLYKGLTAPRNMDLVRSAIDEIRASLDESETFLFVNWDMAIIL